MLSTVSGCLLTTCRLVLVVLLCARLWWVDCDMLICLTSWPVTSWPCHDMTVWRDDPVTSWLVAGCYQLYWYNPNSTNPSPNLSNLILPTSPHFQLRTYILHFTRCHTRMPAFYYHTKCRKHTSQTVWLTSSNWNMMADTKQTKSAPSGKDTVIRPNVTKLIRHECLSVCDSIDFASPFITVSSIRTTVFQNLPNRKYRYSLKEQ